MSTGSDSQSEAAAAAGAATAQPAATAASGTALDRPRGGFQRFVLPLIILAAGAGGAAALVASKPAREPLAARERVWLVDVRPAEPRLAAPELRLYGRVETPFDAELEAAVTADVRALEALEGQFAQTGQPLVRLDDREAKLTLAQANAQMADVDAQIQAEDQRFENDERSLDNERRLLEIARDEAARLKKLATSSMASVTAVDTALQAVEKQAMAVSERELAIRDHANRRAMLEARLDRERAARDRAQLDLDRTVVRAPFAGRVARVTVSEGDRVRPGDPLVTMFDTSRLEVRAQVPLRYMAEIQAASERGVPVVAQAVVDGRSVSLTLDRLSAQVNESGGGADALFRVSGGERWLQLGRIVSVAMSLPPQPGLLALPYGAIYGADRIFVVGEDDRLEGRRVERVGERRRADGGREVLVRADATASGARVLVTQLPNAVDGLKVRARE